MSGLSLRKQAILNIIVSDYVAKATPVASEIIAQRYPNISPATIRNEMAQLEDEGYIGRPHVSAGGTPSDKGYRYYIESLMKDIELSSAEQDSIRNLFQEEEQDLEAWIKLAAKLLSQLVRNVAIATLPKTPQCQFKHLEIVALHEFLALVVLVLYNAQIKQRLLSFAQAITQDELTVIANKLNKAYSGLISSKILDRKLELLSVEKQISEVIIEMMTNEDRLKYDELYLEGLYLMLSQPEFRQSKKMLNVMELIESKHWLKDILSLGLAEWKIRVIVGKEIPDVAVHDLSLVLSGYGAPPRIGGAIGVIGPTRMDYARTIPAVRFLSSVLSNLVTEAYGD